MSGINHLRPVFGSAFNAAILQEIANGLNTAEDIKRAQTAHTHISDFMTPATPLSSRQLKSCVTHLMKPSSLLTFLNC